MSKIFRLHQGASENIEHWQDTGDHLHDNFINSIKDPAGSAASTQITSIPSPFARMDLVRTAFRNVSQSGDLDGTTIYHRLLSDCLDVAEIFFNIEGLADKVEVLEWNAGLVKHGDEYTIDRDSDLGRMVYSDNPKHRLLGETLRMFLFQDSKAFNFEDMKRLYLLNFKQGPELLNIIGGTSPATLFFPSANNLDYVDVTFGNDRMFDGIYTPLYKRGKDFVKFLYAFRAAFPGFSTKFHYVHAYLDLNFEKLDNPTKDAIRAFGPGSYEADYHKIAVGAAGNNAEILGVLLRSKNYQVVQSPDENDFLIEAGKPLDGPRPCVLPNEPFNEPLRYAGGLWQSGYHTKVPSLDPRPLSERTLPNRDHIRYPYLTVSDLLEPYLIQLPFPIDGQKFFDGHYQYKAGEEDHSFVLPLRKEFFRYFSIQDVQLKTVDGKPLFELQQLPSGVRAVLRIPIKNGRHVEYSRIYAASQFQDRLLPADESRNSGVIRENEFTIAVYPFIQVLSEVQPHYRIALIDCDVRPLNKSNAYSLAFYTQDQPEVPVSASPPKVRSDKRRQSEVTTAYYVLERRFDFCEVSILDGGNQLVSRGLVIPLFHAGPIAHKVFKFAVDFGTTNTHIEYRVGNEEPRPFDITESDIQLATFHSPDEEAVKKAFALNMHKNPGEWKYLPYLTSSLIEEFIPAVIRGDTQYKFPQRTSINDNGFFNPDEPNFALTDFNIPFWYFRNVSRSSSIVTADLKWSEFANDKRTERRTRAFLKQLLLMIRNKVLLNGGDLAATEIVWFYPNSMPRFRRNFFQEAWDRYYRRYFPGATHLNRMSESFAPFYYYYHKRNVKPHDRPALGMDIGGGTTDVVVFQGENPILLTSFRFATNAIFGDGFGNTRDANGFLLRHETALLEALSRNQETSNLKHIYEDIKKKDAQSIEPIEFFFSLEENTVIRDRKIPISFAAELAKDQDLKIVILFFYGALTYHIARLMQAKGLPIPEYVTFSGNGSKVVRLVDASRHLSVLLEFTKVIFADVYQVTECPPFELHFSDHPKEITCKGGLECSNFSHFEALESSIQATLIGTNDTDTIPPGSLPLSKAEDPAVVDAVCANVSAFIDRFFEWHKAFSFYQNFGIKPQAFDGYKTILKSKIKVDLISGIKKKLGDGVEQAQDNITETLFFYPLIGAINRLAYNIHKDHH